MAENSRERRQYFRIEDRVSLRVRQVTEEEFVALLKRGPQAEDKTVGLVAQLRSLTNHMGNTLLSVRKDNPDVAQYLQLLDKKIEIIARHLEGKGDVIAPDTRVNIGTGGLAFWRESALPLNTKLEVRFVLFPSYLRVTALAHVVHADEEPQASSAQRFRIGVEFDRIGEAEQEALARHLIELQSAQLRRQRGR